MRGLNFAHIGTKASCMGVILTMLLSIAPVLAEEDTIGSDEYRMSCLVCHGVGGRGDGAMAKLLKVTPSDLTVISKNNGGQYPNIKAGHFPFLHVYQVIDGRAVVAAHGERAMPVWGSRYLVQQPTTPQPYAGEYEKVVRGRILELVYYVQSIQQD